VSPQRFALLGAGFWSQFQLAGWAEIPGAECVAICNRTKPKAEALAERFAIPHVYDDAQAMLDQESLDFVDVVTDVDTHARFVQLAASKGLPVICQKPMGPSYAVAESMVATCRQAGVPFFVHENWRWQKPLREVKRVLDEGAIGNIFRARIQFCSSTPVFDNQPFLKELEQFILTDIGSHILDVARFLFGEASSLYCQTHRLNDIAGEDVATTVMQMGGGATVVCDMSYASRHEHERFPETYVFVEGDRGALELGPDYWLRVTTEEGTMAKRHLPQRYNWADPVYDLVHSSIVPCNANLYQALSGAGVAETTGQDNLKTVRLVFASYESAATNQVITID
jgi:D-apiose dehydrogenase